jgi:polyphosphate kinase
VTIDLIVRGICCLRPKMPGLSDNIRVISIVGRFLEHSRIFYFENAGQPKVFLSSADWMPRNFYRRIELAFPVEDPGLRDQIINEVLPSFLHDRVKARELQPNGKYRRLKPEGSEPRAQAQWHFREASRERARKMSGSKKKLHAAKLTPITVATDSPVTPNPEAQSTQKSGRSAMPESGSSASATTQKKS